MRKFIFFFILFLSCSENYSETEKNCKFNDRNFQESICSDVDIKAGLQEVKREQVSKSINSSEINLIP